MAINSTYSLETIEFIGGSNKTLFFDVFDEKGDPLDLNGATCTWKLRRFGNFGEDALLTKTGIITGTNQFKVVLSSSDTQSLIGKYTQQPIIVDFGGKKYYPSQGIINIDACIL